PTTMEKLRATRGRLGMLRQGLAKVVKAILSKLTSDQGCNAGSLLTSSNNWQTILSMHENHGHEHPHGHTHSHAPAHYTAAFAIGVALNLGFVVAEIVFGLSAHSLALLSDAGHNLTDGFGLLLAWGATRMAKSIPTTRRTYGWRKFSILAA